MNKWVYKPFAQMQLKYAKMQHLPLPASLCAKVGRLSQRTNSVSTKPSTNKDVFDGGIYNGLLLNSSTIVFFYLSTEA